jgi:hypothetical protein
MAISVRLDPWLETRLEAEARRRGVTKSDVIKDALERVLKPTPTNFYSKYAKTRITLPASRLLRYPRTPEAGLKHGFKARHRTPTPDA